MTKKDMFWPDVDKNRVNKVFSKNIYDIIM